MATPNATLILLLTPVLACFHASPQQVGTNKVEGQADTYTLSVKSQLVVETVMVKDK